MCKAFKQKPNKNRSVDSNVCTLEFIHIPPLLMALLTTFEFSPAEVRKFPLNNRYSADHQIKETASLFSVDDIRPMKERDICEK